jgi:hypothetical protein
LARPSGGRKNTKRTGDNHRLAQEQKTLAWGEQSGQQILTREDEKLRQQTKNQVGAVHTREGKISKYQSGEEHTVSTKSKRQFFHCNQTTSQLIHGGHHPLSLFWLLEWKIVYGSLLL